MAPGAKARRRRVAPRGEAPLSTAVACLRRRPRHGAAAWRLWLALLAASCAPPRAEAKSPGSPLKVIGLGAGRTGTQSMRKALEVLGFKVLGDKELVWGKDTRPAMLAAWEGNREPLRQIIEEKGYNATMGLDTLANVIWEMYDRNGSDVKAILTDRPPDDWVMSMWKHIFWEARYMSARYGPERYVDYCRDQPNLFIFHALLTPLRGQSMSFCSYWQTPGQMSTARMGYMARRRGQIRLVNDSSRLLVFNVKEGWGPLCDFLGVPVPEQAFPRNDLAVMWTEDFRRWQRWFWFQQAVFFVLHFGLLWALCFHGSRRCRQWCCRRRAPGNKSD